MTGVHSEKLGWVVSFQLTLVTSLSLLGRLSIVWALWMLLPCLMIPPGGGGDTEPGDDFSAVVILDIEMVFRETTKSKAVPSFPRAVVGPKIAQNICVFGYDRSVST